MDKSKPYTQKKIGPSNTFVIEYDECELMTIENSNEIYVNKLVGLLNGAFINGVARTHSIFSNNGLIV